jgi:glutamyl-Q tRNA(Asp) synthetase
VGQPDSGGPNSRRLAASHSLPLPLPLPYIGRFAPSPSGPLHFGSLLAAVGSYLQARAANGAWLIRIEDLDTPRVIPGAADAIIATLAALGFEWHGAIEYQSRRLDQYAAAIAQLQMDGHLYACSCSRAQIAAALQPVEEEPRYPGTCRHRHEPHGAPTALRFIAPSKSINFVDCIQGPQTQDVAATSGDFVVQRRDGIYAYHLAVVVDDAAQGITEIVRGADLLTSTPRHSLLQQALCVRTPSYAHLPVALDSEGRKLSKSAQSLAIETRNAGPLLWQALQSLRQTPPVALYNAPLSELWTWAIAHWSSAPLVGHTTCLAPASQHSLIAKVC